MMRSQKIFFLCFTFIFLLSHIAHATCINKGGGVWATADNTATACMECVSAASAGDTINVVAGDGAATWDANSIVIPSNKPLNLVGPGADNLTITTNGASDRPIILISSYVGTSELPATTISYFKFETPEDVSANWVIHAQGQGWRIHHNTHNNKSNHANQFVWAQGIGGVESYGLIDNNTLYNSKIYSRGSTGYQNAIWNTATALGSQNAVYIEDNTFTANVTASDGRKDRLAVDAHYAGKYVVRYNTFVNQWILAHGIQSDSERGTRQWEIYGNSFSAEYDFYNDAITILSGVGAIHHNYFVDTPKTWQDNVIVFGHNRTTTAYGAAGKCDGNSNWDGNDAGKGTGWPCRDQIGAGVDTSRWVSPMGSNLPGPAQTKEPSYTFINYQGAALKISANVAATHISSNRDYYTNDDTNCPAGGGSCTAGVGRGTLGNRPTSCTTGVAYWATDQSTTDLTGMVGANPTTPISGTLYKCTAPNTWTSYYAPYTYPHPLRKLSYSAPSLPSPPVLHSPIQ